MGAHCRAFVGNLSDIGNRCNGNADGNITTPFTGLVAACMLLEEAIVALGKDSSKESTLQTCCTYLLLTERSVSQ